MADHTNAILEVIREFDSSVKAKPKQIDCLNYLLNGKDVIANLPVGYGKSLIYQVFSHICKVVHGIVNPITLVISPLNIIQEEQIERLKQRSVSCCKLSYCETDGAPDLKETDLIEKV